MHHNIFISYSNSDIDIVDNLRGQFHDLGIEAWIYSRDRTLGEDVWKEVEEKITKSDVVIFVVSDYTPDASGQQKELQLVLNQIEPVTGSSRIIPLFISGTNPKNYPEVLRNKNGDFLDVRTVKTVAWKIAKHAFPSLIKKKSEEAWNYPIPGMWLVISNLDGIIEQYFDIGDKLYFRAISPMGLFECYAPKMDELFWVSPENVQPYLEIKDDKDVEEFVPYVYTIMGMVEMQMLGWDVWQVRAKKNKNDIIS